MRRIPFDVIPVIESPDGVRSQMALRDDHRLRLVEFAPGLREAEWCIRSHIGYVLAGRLEVDFGDTVEVFNG
jgi:hypothetical protein